MVFKILIRQFARLWWACDAGDDASRNTFRFIVFNANCTQLSSLTSPRRRCLLSTFNQFQPLPRVDKKNRGYRDGSRSRLLGKEFLTVVFWSLCDIDGETVKQEQSSISKLRMHFLWAEFLIRHGEIDGEGSSRTRGTGRKEILEISTFFTSLNLFSFGSIGMHWWVASLWSIKWITCAMLLLTK